MKTDATKEVKFRPNWHIDAKWICGLFFMFVFGLTLFTYGLFTLTSEKNGIDTMTKMITLAFSRDGIDSSKDIDEFRAKLDASPTKAIKPNPALNISLTKAEVDGKTPREIRYLIFRQVATPIYFNGKGAEEVLNTPEARANFEKDTFFLRLFSENSHKKISSVLIVLSAISAITLGLVAFFSYRFGRIANPGFVVLMTAWPGALFFSVLAAFSKNFTDQTISFGSEDAGYGAMIGPFVREIMPDFASSFSRIYLYALALGLGLLLLAGVSKLIFRFIKR